MSLSRKRVWSVADFADHAHIGHRVARRILRRIDVKHGGKLLIPSEGTNRGYSFWPAVLWKLEPDLFTEIESVAFRLDALEDAFGDMRVQQRATILQTGANTREIAKMQRRSRAA